MSDCVCKKCKCVRGRSKLKDGVCIDALFCMKMIKEHKEKKEQNYEGTNLLKSRYFEKYRYNG